MATRRATAHNLSAPLTSFIGREHELDQVRTVLGRTRLLTLVGAGGIGKTRLALELAADVVDQFADGVWLIELASLTEGHLVAQAVASVLGIQEEPGQPLDRTLAHALRHQHRLLILDNCEQVVDACAHLADPLLRACPTLHILATSREALEVEGEVAWQVPPLSLPEPPRALTGISDWLETAEAARLFVDRAAVAQPRFEVRPGDARTIAEICRRLDGMPLAIELAAARARLLGLDQILARLEDRFRLLTGTSRSAPPRHQSLRAAIEWSYGMLSDPERHLFDQLAVFVGGWTFEAAEAVCGPNILDLLARLVEKSLVMVEPASDGSVRHRMLETLREFAAARLQESGDLDDFRARHAAYFVALAEQAGDHISGATYTSWLPRLEAERDNVRAALEWAVDHEPVMALRVGASLWRYWERSGSFSEGRGWLERALMLSTPDAALCAAALHGAGHLAWRQRDLDHAEQVHVQALELCYSLGDEEGVARATYGLARVAGSRGDFAAALAYAEDALRIQRDLDLSNDVALTLNVMGEIARSGGDYARASALYEESLALFRETGEPLGIQIELHNLAFVAKYQGDAIRAAALFAESLEWSRQFGIRMGIASCIGGLAGVALDLHQPLVAVHLFGAAELLREAIAFPMEVVDRAELERDLANLRDVLDRDALEQAWQSGQAMPLDQVIQLARGIASRTEEPRASATPSILTRRELELAVLVARGMTNRQIADALVISKTTADRHVSNILSKLHLSTRAQMATWVVEQQLLTNALE